MKGHGGEPGRIRARLRDERGQLSVEFTGMVPIILVTLVLLWQAVLVGYTFTLASGAADEGVRKAVAADAGDWQSRCEAAVNERLPGAWEEPAEIDCGGGGDSDMVTTTVTLKAPVLFPGFADLPVPVRATAGAAAEGK
ncbi:TadE/TadG family type IV pilus assembly protein [Streptomyces sp. NRRL S-4]|uniref:TadE/TadG family type IV pilus assembly protein n=1 Tax=Streptomyces sp. NRRL S-4 TaxID=1519471 RepID=UPI0006B55D19|nr:TadE family protein [Streptomyces sp. NRRL S-4]KPC80262.1 septum formation initiator [Streptomyces sp. NRRL S-4]